MMNVKVLLGFLGGAALASVGSYWLTHRQSPAPTVAAIAPATPGIAKQEPPQLAPLPVAPAEPEPSPSVARQPGKKPLTKRVAQPVTKLAERLLPAYVEPVEVPAQAQAVASTPVPLEPPVETRPEPMPAPPPVVEAKQTTSEPQTVTIPDGTVFRVRLGETLSAKRNRPGDAFAGTLDQELVVDGFVIAERGSRVEGRVVQAEEAGRARGLSHLGLELIKIHTADDQFVSIHTAKFEQLGPTSKTDDWAKIAMGTAIGGAIGAAAGQGKGAAIGAAAGAAAGAGTVAATRGKPAEIPVESRINFKLDQPVTITEKLRR